MDQGSDPGVTMSRNGAVIDLNSDLGEGFGPFRVGADQALFPLISSANVACGFHGGDPLMMERTIALATAAGVAIGAHPGYPDRAGFGRRAIAATPDEIRTDVIYQVGAMAAFCKAAGVPLQHVKAHGALYNQAVGNARMATAIAEGVRAVDPGLRFFAIAGSALETAASRAGLPVIREAFADRAYLADGSLVPRSRPGAVIEDRDLVADRMHRLVTEGVVETIDGELIPMEADTICIHSDTPTAVALAKAIVRRFREAGIAIRHFGERS
jgi:5-oxoprolinase (ATP-hydrolysing) subunit A